MTMIHLSSDSIDDRKNVVFQFAKTLSVWGYKYLTHPHLEIHEELYRLKKEKTVFLYASLHKSLWEATGLMVPLYLNKLPVPYAGTGDNLIGGKFFQKLAKKTGVFLIKRPTNRSEMLVSAKLLKEQVINHLAYGNDVLVFPEGTRKNILSHGEYGKFFPTTFEAMLEYEKIKIELSTRYPGLSIYDSYIIPTNVDYTKIREDWEMLADYRGKPPTLHILDSLKMLKHIRGTHISFGRPIKVSDHMDMDRKELATYTREQCLELVKILPINIVSLAVLDSVDGDHIDTSKIEKNIARNIQRLEHLKDRFRDFNADDLPSDILKNVSQYENYFKIEKIEIKNLDFYRLYANYIRHYLSK
jgi:1-acyl-sn-glycerol-3-phosphate acyltransferase